MRAHGFSAALRRDSQPLAESADPADLPRRNTHHEREGAHISIDHGARAYKSVFADGYAAYNRTIRAQRGASPNYRVPIFVFATDGRARIVDIGKHHARAAKDIVFQNYIVVHGNVVLNFDVGSNPNAISNVYILPKRAPFADYRSAADMYPVPNATSGADHRAGIHDGGWVNLRF